jgi:hypothetical protein
VTILLQLLLFRLQLCKEHSKTDIRRDVIRDVKGKFLVKASIPIPILAEEDFPCGDGGAREERRGRGRRGLLMAREKRAQPQHSHT